MAQNIYRFDPSNYDSRAVDKPLAQIMREAEIERSRQGARYFVAAWQAIKGLFAAKTAQSEAPKGAANDDHNDEGRIAA